MPLIYRFKAARILAITLFSRPGAPEPDHRFLTL
jgi:hypothetical protein